MKQTTMTDFMQLEEHTHELEVINEELKETIKKEVEKNRLKDEMMFQQSRFSSMGEMIGNIAHQWRQPLMELSSLFINIEAQLKLNGTVSSAEIIETIGKSNDITKYMSNTINDFQNFFAKDKEKVCFNISEQLNTSINIISSGLKKNKIHMDIIIIKNPQAFGFKNEYSQAIINIVNNARDMLIERKIENPKIKIFIEEDENTAVLRISDNAGGIEKAMLTKIFEPFFTQEKSNGTGIGLFMSKLIIENNMGGKLMAINNNEGAEFIIVVPKAIKT